MKNIKNHAAWGGFDRSQHCFNAKMIQPKADHCCGEKNHRFPFNSQNGQRSCCGKHTFWTSEKCCKNDNIEDILKCSADFNVRPESGNRPTI